MENPVESRTEIQADDTSETDSPAEPLPPWRRQGQRFGSSEERDQAKQVFIAALRNTCNVRHAARAARIDRALAYLWRRDDSDFAHAWQMAEADAADLMDGEAWRRGIEGYPEIIVSAGKVVLDKGGQPLVITRHSDRLLLALLRAHHPRYRDKPTPAVTAQQQAPQVIVLLPKLVPLPEPRALTDTARRMDAHGDACVGDG
jgi:hypothetical protein